MRGRSVVHSSAKHTPGKKTTGTDSWRTPTWLLDMVRRVFRSGIDVDPCADSDLSYHFAQRNITKEENALNPETRWFGQIARTPPRTLFCNPPYSQALAFNRRLISELYNYSGTDTEAIVLIAARTDTEKWRTLAEHTSAICLINGRVQFDDPRLEIEHCGVLWPISDGNCGSCDKALTAVAGFPSALLYFGHNPTWFGDVTSAIGGIWLPRRS